MTIYKPGTAGICPHCGLAARFEAAAVHYRNNSVGCEEESAPTIYWARCPSCVKVIITAVPRGGDPCLVCPRAASRRPLPKSLSKELSEDFLQATLIASASPKAAAALLRRCLQGLFNVQGVTGRDLKGQIETASPSLPPYINKYIDHVRTLGNIAAHPVKDGATGEILDIEPGEVDWLMELLEQLFDYYYEQPARADRAAALIEQKLKREKNTAPSVPS